MSTRIKFFFRQNEANETREYLTERGVKTFIRLRTQADPEDDNSEPYGFDLFTLNDDDAEMALTMIEYEFGGDWGKTAER